MNDRPTFEELALDFVSGIAKLGAIAVVLSALMLLAAVL